MMHSKTCCALFLLALVACQAAPSSKIIEKKSISETETKLAEETLNPEDTGADKDRAKKSTTFCVELRSGKEEVVPCRNQEIKQYPVPNIKPSYAVVQTAPAPQFPLSNVLVQPVPSQPQPSQIVVQPNYYQVPEPVPQFIQVQSQQPSVVEPAPQKSHQTVIQPVATAPAPTPIINIIPAPVSPPCEHAPQKPQPPQEQIHTVHIVQPKPEPQPQSKPVLEPKVEVKEKPVPQRVEVAPIVTPSCKSELIIAPTPVEYYPVAVRQEEPARLVEYVEAPQQEYECSCRTEHQYPTRTRPYKHQVKLYPSSGASFRASPIMSMQYNPNIESDSASPIFTQTREAEARHHKKKQPLYPVQVQVQPAIYSSPNYPSKYEPDSYQSYSYKYEPDSYQSYRPVYISPTYYPETNYYSKENTPYSSVPLVTVNTGGPFYRNSQDSEGINTSPQEALSNLNEISNNQKREASSIQLKNGEQRETAKGLPVESIQQTLTKTEVENMK
ncbi:adhesive plaque matrix protein-like [Nylanderia fulva]|uniref:adhesive plaque matrix protein-like n=1 Tax=Nylanderia fulva TaxID=613905 RepID=UPI0010FB4F20|nr:adhesive plaque matrix protein-like [Nylanderia fulva]